MQNTIIILHFLKFHSKLFPNLHTTFLCIGGGVGGKTQSLLHLKQLSQHSNPDNPIPHRPEFEMVAVTTSTQKFTGGSYFRHRVVLSTLSSKSIRITDIRADDSEAPGLSPAEVSFIRLIDKLTSGAVIQINETGTSLFYKPGLLVGSNSLTHECHPSRPLSYYIEPLLMLAPFSKQPLNIVLQGPTHSTTDLCADTLTAVSIPLLRRLTAGTPISPQLTVRKRAMASGPKLNGGGRAGVVHFRCELASSKIKPVDLMETGYVKRIRGIAFANRVSPNHISRIVDTTRKILNQFSPDVYIHTDHNNNADCGVGFGLHLVAETTEGCLVGADWSSSDSNVSPEGVAKQACNMLLEEVEHGGCVDTSNSCLALLYCALADSDISRVRVGKLNKASVSFLRDLERFFGVVFKIRMEKTNEGDSSESESDSDTDQGGNKSSTPSNSGIVMSCIGVGLTNIARQRF